MRTYWLAITIVCLSFGSLICQIAPNTAINVSTNATTTNVTTTNVTTTTSTTPATIAPNVTPTPIPPMGSLYQKYINGKYLKTTPSFIEEFAQNNTQCFTKLRAIIGFFSDFEQALLLSAANKNTQPDRCFDCPTYLQHLPMAFEAQLKLLGEQIGNQQLKRRDSMRCLLNLGIPGFDPKLNNTISEMVMSYLYTRGESNQCMVRFLNSMGRVLFMRRRFLCAKITDMETMSINSPSGDIIGFKWTDAEAKTLTDSFIDLSQCINKDRYSLPQTVVNSISTVTLFPNCSATGQAGTLTPLGPAIPVVPIPTVTTTTLTVMQPRGNTTSTNITTTTSSSTTTTDEAVPEGRRLSANLRLLQVTNVTTSNITINATSSESATTTNATITPIPIPTPTSNLNAATSNITTTSNTTETNATTMNFTTAFSQPIIPVAPTNITNATVVPTTGVIFTTPPPSNASQPIATLTPTGTTGTSTVVAVVEQPRPIGLGNITIPTTTTTTTTIMTPRATNITTNVTTANATTANVTTTNVTTNATTTNTTSITAEHLLGTISSTSGGGVVGVNATGNPTSQPVIVPVALGPAIPAPIINTASGPSLVMISSNQQDMTIIPARPIPNVINKLNTIRSLNKTLLVGDQNSPVLVTNLLDFTQDTNLYNSIAKSINTSMKIQEMQFHLLANEMNQSLISNYEYNCMPNEPINFLANVNNSTELMNEFLKMNCLPEQNYTIILANGISKCTGCIDSSIAFGNMNFKDSAKIPSQYYLTSNCLNGTKVTFGRWIETNGIPFAFYSEGQNNLNSRCIEKAFSCSTEAASDRFCPSTYLNSICRSQLNVQCRSSGLFDVVNGLRYNNLFDFVLPPQCSIAYTDNVNTAELERKCLTWLYSSFVMRSMSFNLNNFLNMERIMFSSATPPRFLQSVVNVPATAGDDTVIVVPVIDDPTNSDPTAALVQKSGFSPNAVAVDGVRANTTLSKETVNNYFESLRRPAVTPTTNGTPARPAPGTVTITATTAHSSFLTISFKLIFVLCLIFVF